MPTAQKRNCSRCGGALKLWSKSSVCWRCMMTVSSGAAISPEVPDAGRNFGDYFLEKEIAHGGMGVVYRARQISLNRQVALKLLLLGRYSSAENIERFKREAQSVAALHHPNIVAIYEVSQFDGQHFFSMEYVDGRNLADILRDGPLPPLRAAEYARTIATAIQYAHSQGVLHRDLKPSNVLIDGAGQIRVTDFGLAKKLDGSSDLTVTGQMVGTPNYLSPEAAAGRTSSIATASDVYAIGALLYELLTGRPPFLAESLTETLLQIRETEPVPPRALNPAVPRDLDTITLKCLEKNPARRYASAAALAEDLQCWLQHRPILARPTGTLERIAKWTHRRPALAAAIGGIAIAVLLGFFGIVWQWQRAVAQHEITRQNLYVSNVHGASQALNENNFGLARELLAGCAPRPSEKDIREFTWRYLNEQARGDELGSVAAHSGVVSALVFSPDGKTLASGSWDRTLRLWRMEKGTLVKVEMAFTNLPNSVFGLSFSSDGQRLIAGGNEWLQELNLRDQTSAPVLEKMRIPKTGTYNWSRPVFRPQDSGWVAIGFGASDWGYNNGGDTRLWQPATGESFDLMNAGGRPVFSPDGHWLATGASDANVKIWDADTRQLIGTLRCNDNVIALAFSPDGLHLATASWTGQLAIWNVATLKLEHELRAGGAERTRALAFSPDGKTLASGGADQLVRLWNVNDGKATGELKGQGSEVWSLVYAPDGKIIFSGDAAGAIKLWPANPADGEEHVGKISLANGDRSTLLPWGLGNPLVSPDGRFLAGAQSHRSQQSPFGSRVVIWDFSTLKPVAHLDSERFPIAFTPDGKILITVSDEPVCRFWEVASGRCVGEFQYGDGGWHVEAPAMMSPSGALFAYAGFHGPATIWDVLAQRVRATTAQSAHSMYSFAFSPDEHYFAYLADGLKDICLMDLKTKTNVSVFKGHTADIVKLAFSPDGRLLASCGRDSTIRLWNVADGTVRAVLNGHRDAVNRIAFSPDGNLLVSGSQDRTVKFWDLGTLRELATEKFSQSVTHVEFSSSGDTLLVGEGSSGPLHIRRVPGMSAAPRAAVPDQNWSRLVECARTNLAAGKRRPVTPPRAPQLDARLIDLSAHYNASLKTMWGVSQAWDSLADLEAGAKKFGGTLFDIRGLVILRGSQSDFAWPERVNEIVVGQKCTRLKFLHAAGARPSETEGTTLGSYVIHFEDGSTAEQSIVMGRDVWAWHVDPAQIQNEGTNGPHCVWRGSTAYSLSSGKVTALFASTWENPRPSLRVESVDFISAITRSEPFLVSITAE